MKHRSGVGADGFVDGFPVDRSVDCSDASVNEWSDRSIESAWVDGVDGSGVGVVFDIAHHLSSVVIALELELESKQEITNCKLAPVNFATGKYPISNIQCATNEQLSFLSVPTFGGRLNRGGDSELKLSH